MRKGLSLWWLRRRSPQRTMLINIEIILVLLLIILIPAIHALPSDSDTTVFSDVISTEFKAKQLLNRKQPNHRLAKIDFITIDSIDYYEAITSQTIQSSIGIIDIEVSSLINSATEEITITSKYLRTNNQEFIESTNQLILFSAGEFIILDNIENKQMVYKAVDNYIEPLINPEYLQNQKLNQSHSFAVIATTNAGLENHILTVGSYAIHIVQSNDLESLFKNKRILRIANKEPTNLRKLVNYARQLFREEAEKLAKDLQLRISHQDVIPFAELREYLDEEPWDPDPGKTSPYQRYVTPEASAITSVASRYSSPQDIYDYAREWLWVSDMQLHNSLEKWLLPTSFLSETPQYTTNPSPGKPVSDCSEQANTLCSILRASGIDPENVRVAIGEVNFDGSIGGHAWVEIKEDGKWLVLDPTCGPYYDDDQQRLFNRDGVDYDYWKYYPYPIENIWVYYNDVYYTDENAEVADGWSIPYDIFLDEEMLGGFFSYGSESLYYFYIFLAISSSIFLIIFLGLRMKGSRK